MKIAETVAAALGVIDDGTIFVVGGFGDRGIPFALLAAVAEGGARHLTIVSVNAGRGSTGIARLIAEKRVDRIICAFPRTAGSVAFEEAYTAGRIALELVPMGTLVARLQAGASGTAAFYTPVSAGTMLAKGKETREFAGQMHVLEHALRGDVALVRADRADCFANLGYRGTDRNLNPLAARACDRAVAEVATVREEALDPERVETPGLYVQRVVAVAESAA